MPTGPDWKPVVQADSAKLKSGSGTAKAVEEAVGFFKKWSHADFSKIKSGSATLAEQAARAKGRMSQFELIGLEDLWGCVNQYF
ncbi:unnamed protein product [Urochloa humidicola]